MENLIDLWLRQASHHERAAVELDWDLKGGSDHVEFQLHMEAAEVLRRCAKDLKKAIGEIKRAAKYVIAELEEDFDINNNGGPNKAMRLAQELEQAMKGQLQ